MRSIKNKLHLAEAFLEDEKTIEAFCVTETWLTKGKIDLLHFDGYNIVSSFCRLNREGGSVCILLKNDIESVERNDIVDISVEYVVEMCAVDIPKFNLLLITLYWNDTEVDIFYERLKMLLELLIRKDSRKNIIIGGDFNTDVSKKTNKARTLLDFMLTYNFHQHVSDPTRVTNTTATCLDLLFTNSTQQSHLVSVHDYGFSDHKGVVIILPKLVESHGNKWQIEKRIFNYKNMNLFKAELQKVNWNDVITEDKNVDENYNSFNDLLQKILNNCIPKKSLKINRNPRKAWLTTGIKKSCQHKRLLKILTSQSDSEILSTHYKQYEKLLKKTIYKSKKLQYIRQMKSSKNLTKTMWQIIKQRTNKVSKTCRQNIKLKINKVLVEDPITVSNEFNNFFASVGGTADDEATQPQGRPVLNPTNNTLYLRPVDPREVNTIIRELKNKRSFGIDELPPTLIKNCADELTLPYVLMINQSFSQGVFPLMLKKSLIKPILKKGDITDPCNYRPIALLPTSSKIFETAMAKRLNSFCEKYNIFNDSQHGFRRNRSTTLAVYKFIQEILNTLNIKKYAIGVFLDLSKAYDKVLYKILLNKLYGIGVRGITHDWFASYLNNRDQQVEIENCDFNSGIIKNFRSDPKTMKSSIPQGSVLGCILFLIYINDLPQVLNTLCVLFADDISAVIKCTNVIDLNNKLDSTLNEIVKWLTDHNLEINFTKTKLVQFRPHQKTPLNINYSLNNVQIDCVNDFKLLGLHIDEHVNWKTHVQNLKSKLSRFTYALNELKKGTNLQTAITAYYAYAHSLLRYGVLLWGNSTDANDVFILQKRCIRILMNIDNTVSCRQHFIEQKILTLTSIYILETCIFVRNNTHFFRRVKDNHTRLLNTRHRERLAPPQSRLVLHSNGPHVMCVKIYNNIPIDIKNEHNYIKFNKQLKSYLTTKCFYSLKEFFDTQ